MKFLLLSIFVMLAAPPLQASFCDMCADKNIVHQDMSGTDMHAGSTQQMDHGMEQGQLMSMDMSMDHNNDDQKMDCCDAEAADTGSNCSALTHCGASTASMAIISFDIPTAWVGTNKGQVQPLSQVPPNQFSAPPFRPPIS